MPNTNPAFIDDTLKPEVDRFLMSNAGRLWLRALRERKPAQPNPSMEASTKLSMYDQQAGYENCLEELVKISQQSETLNPQQRESVLLDPRD